MDLLGSQSVNALKSCAEVSAVTDDAFSALLEFSHESILKEELDTEPELFSKLDTALAKRIHAALVSLILEAAKTDIQDDQLGMILDECNFSVFMKETFISSFNDHRSELRDHLSLYGLQCPYVQDLNWRLDYSIKNNHLHKVDALRYTLSMHMSDAKPIKFTCSREELQDFSAKLKEAVKAVERATNA